MRRSSRASRSMTPGEGDGAIEVRGARAHNLADIDVDVPRGAMVVFTGVSGSGKSSLAFGTIFAESQRRFLDSISPYARRLIDQAGVPAVDSIEGLPPAVALQQSRGAPSARSSVGSLTTVSNSLRMLYSRAGTYPRGAEIIHADGFSPNTPAGACPECHGIGRRYDATEATLVPDRELSIRDGAVAAWPSAWHGQNLRDILTTLGIDIDVPWAKLPKKTRDWILFTEEQPQVPVFPGFDLGEVRAARRAREEPAYLGTFTGARRYVLHTHANSPSERMRGRARRYLVATECALCGGKRLRREALAVKVAGLNIAELGELPMDQVAQALAPLAAGNLADLSPEKAIVAERIAGEIIARIKVIQSLGLGYLSLARTAPSLSDGELQRLRIATQVQSKLFGVVYVMDEPSAGLHPADTDALLTALDQLRQAGNSLCIVEHSVDVMRRADWLIDLGPGAGRHGGRVLYSGPPEGLRRVAESETRRHLFGPAAHRRAKTRAASGTLQLRGIHCHNLRGLDVDIPLGVFTAVCGVSGSGKTSLVSRALVDLLRAKLGIAAAKDDEVLDPLLSEARPVCEGQLGGDCGEVRRLVVVDQGPIGRTPRSIVATYAGALDPIRQLFAAVPLARRRRYDAGHFSFNVAKGRCPHCAGEGSVSVELLFMPGVVAPCPVCEGRRYAPETLEVKLRGKSIADVLAMTVEEARGFFGEEEAVMRPLAALRDVGLDYIYLGQPATELSGGEAQRVKLASELRRAHRAGTCYVLDEPTAGLHPADVEVLLSLLGRLVDEGGTVVAALHDMQAVAACDWVIEMGPGAGEHGGRVVAEGPPRAVAAMGSRTAPYLRAALGLLA